MSLGTAKITIQLDSVSISTQTGTVPELSKLPDACAAAIANAIKMLEPSALKAELAKALVAMDGLGKLLLEKEAKIAEMSKPIAMIEQPSPKKSRKPADE